MSTLAADSQQTIFRPRIFLPLESGILTGAENGLFLIRDRNQVEPLGTAHSVNEIVIDKSGYLIATDGGAFSFRPDRTTERLSPVGNYRRSVRQIYAYSDHEYFAATQDGLKYLADGNFRALGKNTEIGALVGKIGDEIIGISGSEVVLATGEFANFYECNDTVNCAVSTLNEVYVGTASGLFVLRDHKLELVFRDAPVTDIAGLGTRLLLATPKGLFRFLLDGPQSQASSKLREGAYSDLQVFDEGILLVSPIALTILSYDNDSPKAIIPTSDARKCNRFRQEGARRIFCLNNGLLIYMGDKDQYRFIHVETEVRDALLRKNNLIVAADGGIFHLDMEHTPGSSAGTAVGALAFSCVCCLSVFWWWHRRRIIIFLSYRRQDAGEIVGRIRDRLKKSFGSQSVRMDVYNIEKGSDFRKEIQRNIQESHVVMVVIGPHWIGAQDSDGELRLFSEVDYVRFEIELSLRLKKAIVPVLLSNTNMPLKTELPPSIAELGFRESLKLRSDPDFDRDISALISATRKLVARHRKKSSSR